MAWWQLREQTIVYMDELRPGPRAEIHNMMKSAFQSPLTRLWYDTRKARLNPDVVRYIDDLLV